MKESIEDSLRDVEVYKMWIFILLMGIPYVVCTPEIISQFKHSIDQHSPEILGQVCSEDVRFCSPFGCVSGRDKTVKFFNEYFKYSGETHQYIDIIDASYDNDSLQGSMEWIWHATRNGSEYTQNCALIYSLNSEGKFKYLREYFNPSQMHQYT